MIDAGGVAYQLFALGPEDDGRYCFSVMREDNALFETFAHELGHNFGCQHDRCDNSTDGFFPYSYGYRQPCPGPPPTPCTALPCTPNKDIMSYPPGTTVQFFSNPDVDVAGLPIGGTDEHGLECNNALTINQTARTLANFRPSTLESAPPARLYVNAGAAPGGDGASWATALDSTQDAMGIAVRSRGAVDEIWVAAGTYYPDLGTGERTFHFRLIEGVSIYGGFAGTETDLGQRNVVTNVTVLSGDIGLPGDDADNSYHVVNSNNLDATAVLDGFTITGGRANGKTYPQNSGGGLLNQCGSPTIVNCRFVANWANWSGGAVYNEYGSPTFVACSFADNQSQHGGAVRHYYGTAEHTGCTFTNNAASFIGGAVDTDGSTVSFIDCTFEGNSAAYGGAIHHFQSTPTYWDCSFLNGNSATEQGGAVYNNGSDSQFDYCDFSDNYAFYSGGAIHNLFSDTVINYSTFTSNYVSHKSGAGGAIANYDCTPNLFDCEFTANDAPYGGAMQNVNSPAWIDTCDFLGNTAYVAGAINNEAQSGAQIVACTFFENGADYAGAINSYQSSPAVWLSMFDSNSAVWSGGAVTSGDGASPWFDSNDFLSNTATYGGAAQNDPSSDPLFTLCEFRFNTAEIAGGAANNTTSTATFADCLFDQNAADVDTFAFGGAMNSDFGASPLVRNCEFTLNSATYVGGAITEGGAAGRYVNCLFADNTADYGGGAATGGESTTQFVNCRFLGNVAGQSGGAIDINFSAPALTNGVFSGNRAMAGTGGALTHFADSDATLINCTLSANSAGFAGGGVATDSPSLVLSNTLLWGNTVGAASGEDEQLFLFAGSAALSHCSVQGWTGSLGGTANDGSNPQFVDANGADNVAGTIDDDLSLGVGSPARDSGDNAALPADTLDLDDDGDLLETLPIDAAGGPRVANGTVDRGAYEAPAGQACACGDLNGDGIINLIDFPTFSVCFGLTGPSLDCPAETLACADLDVNGIVNLTDFTTLATIFGLTPDGIAPPNCLDVD